MLNIVRSFTRTDVRVISAGSLAVGAVTGYLVAKKRLSSKFEERTQQEVEDIRDMYKRRYKEGQYADPESTSAVLSSEDTGGLDIAPVVPKTNYQTVVDDLGYNAPTDGEIDGIVIQDNTFDGETRVTVRVDPLGERHVGVEERTPDRPYVISRAQFDDAEVGLDQVTVTWWDKDDTLSDEQERIMTDIDGTVGIDNLQKFGLGSDDENVVYIRNERISTDFEVVRDYGSYNEEVAGNVPPETFQRIRKPARPSDD